MGSRAEDGEYQKESGGEVMDLTSVLFGVVVTFVCVWIIPTVFRYRSFRREEGERFEKLSQWWVDSLRSQRVQADALERIAKALEK